jgi:hypothetical protein
VLILVSPLGDSPSGITILILSISCLCNSLRFRTVDSHEWESGATPKIAFLKDSGCSD